MEVVDIYLKGNKLIIVTVIIILFNSCSKESRIDKHISKNFNSVKNEYKLLEDSLKYFANSHLKDFTSEYLFPWQIDSFICMNSSRDKFVATINSSSKTCRECEMDDVTKILGKKFNGVWYFFLGGGTLVVPRSKYGKDGMHPLRMHELSQIAHKEMFGENCLIKKDGEYIVNDAWVDQHFYDKGWGNFKRKEQYDSVHWFYIKDKWNHKFDPEEFKKEKLQ